jgi:hypothetical protein
VEPSTTLDDSPADVPIPNILKLNVIDLGAWRKLALPLKLPAEARLELGWLVRAERNEHSWRAGEEPPSEARKKLKRLQNLANALAKEMVEMGNVARSAVLLSLADVRQFDPQEPSRLSVNFKPIELTIENIERLEDRLSHAIEIARSWHGLPGRDRRLRSLIAKLNQFLIDHTGRGLARASAATKGRGGRAKRAKSLFAKCFYSYSASQSRPPRLMMASRM